MFINDTKISLFGISVDSQIKNVCIFGFGGFGRARSARLGESLSGVPRRFANMNLLNLLSRSLLYSWNLLHSLNLLRMYYLILLKLWWGATVHGPSGRIRQ